MNSSRWFDGIKLGSAKLWNVESRKETFKFWQKFHEGKDKKDKLYEWVRNYDNSESYFTPGLPFDKVNEYSDSDYGYDYYDYD